MNSATIETLEQFLPHSCELCQQSSCSCSHKATSDGIVLPPVARKHIASELKMTYKRLSFLLKFCGISVYKPRVELTSKEGVAKRRICRPKHDFIPLTYTLLVIAAFAIQTSLVQNDVREKKLPDDLFIEE